MSTPGLQRIPKGQACTNPPFARAVASRWEAIVTYRNHLSSSHPKVLAELPRGHGLSRLRPAGLASDLLNRARPSAQPSLRHLLDHLHSSSPGPTSRHRRKHEPYEISDMQPLDYFFVFLVERCGIVPHSTICPLHVASRWIPAPSQILGIRFLRRHPTTPPLIIF